MHSNLKSVIIITITTMLTTSTTNVARAFAAHPYSASRNPTVQVYSASSKNNQDNASTGTAPKRVAPRDSLAETSKTGEFQRRESAWRNWISREPGSKFPPEKDRYHLVVALACPWAHRTLITRAVKGLEDAISVSVVHPIWQKTRPGSEGDQHRGWIFGDPSGKPLANVEGRGGPFPAAFPGNAPDPLFGFRSVRDFYDQSGDTEGKYTVPVLYDKKLNTIVSNESSEIIRMLNSEFNEFAKNPDLDLYPEADKDLQDKINSVNEWVYPNINNGVYRCGFAKTQSAYDQAIENLTDAFDRVESILGKQRYIAGDAFTEADIRLFVTLLRFDEVYIVYFKTNTRSVANSPVILNYCREIYQMPGVKETVDMEQIKAHYFCSHPELNYYSIIPKGPDTIKLLEQPHNRDAL
jgi:putative glutathione S-transferase